MVLSHQPHSKNWFGESPLVLLGQGWQQQLGGWDRMFLWSRGGIQAQAAFLSESGGVGGGPWLLASHEDPTNLELQWVSCTSGLSPSSFLRFPLFTPLPAPLNV